MKNNQDRVNLFWTSGWDSTFRLLQILLIENKEVKPFYIIDGTRKSTPIELTRMEKIRNLILQNHPNIASRFLPLEKTKSQHIPIDKEIANAWRKVRNKTHIGAQYKLLASFCKQKGINNMELSIQKHTNVEQSDSSLAAILSRDHIPKNYQILFEWFRFPLINMSKQEMKKTAQNNEWMPYLRETWFCHRPIYIPFAEPIECGACNPCTIVMEEGLGWRIPLISRWVGPVVKQVSHKLPF